MFVLAILCCLSHFILAQASLIQGRRGSTPRLRSRLCLQLCLAARLAGAIGAARLAGAIHQHSKDGRSHRRSDDHGGEARRSRSGQSWRDDGNHPGASQPHRGRRAGDANDRNQRDGSRTRAETASQASKGFVSELRSLVPPEVLESTIEGTCEALVAAGINAAWQFRHTTDAAQDRV